MEDAEHVEGPEALKDASWPKGMSSLGCLLPTAIKPGSTT